MHTSALSIVHHCYRLKIEIGQNTCVKSQALLMEKLPFPDMLKIIQITAVPNAMAVMDRDVFHKNWLEHLEVYGSREGLLRCAIATPDEFALMRSFFDNTAALEKWILGPTKNRREAERGSTDS